MSAVAGAGLGAAVPGAGRGSRAASWGLAQRGGRGLWGLGWGRDRSGGVTAATKGHGGRSVTDRSEEPTAPWGLTTFLDPASQPSPRGWSLRVGVSLNLCPLGVPIRGRHQVHLRDRHPGSWEELRDLQGSCFAVFGVGEFSRVLG